MYLSKKLSEIAKVINGRAYKADELLDSGKTPVLRVGNLFTNNHWYFSDLDLEGDKYCDNGDLIYAWSASFGPFIWNGGKCIYHYHIWKILCSENIDKQFLYWYLSYQTKNLSSKGNGVGMIHITKGMIEDLDVLLPPLSTQSHIVACLDLAFASIDEQISLLRSNITDVEIMRKSVLEEIFTQGDKNDRMKIHEFADIKSGKRLPKGERLLEEKTPYPYIRVTDFGDEGSIDLSQIKYIPKEIFDGIKNYIITSDDLYISIAGTIGKTGIIPEELNGANLTENAIRLVYKDRTKISNKYIYYFTISENFKIQSGLATRAVAMPKLAITRLKEIEIYLPPIPRQHEIVAHLDRVFAETQSLRGEYEAQIQDLQTLKQSLLEEAFAGRLIAD